MSKLFFAWLEQTDNRSSYESSKILTGPTSSASTLKPKAKNTVIRALGSSNATLEILPDDEIFPLEPEPSLLSSPTSLTLDFITFYKWLVSQITKSSEMPGKTKKIVNISSSAAEHLRQAGSQLPFPSAVTLYHAVLEESLRTRSPWRMNGTNSLRSTLSSSVIASAFAYILPSSFAATIQGRFLGTTISFAPQSHYVYEGLPPNVSIYTDLVAAQRTVIELFIDLATPDENILTNYLYVSKYGRGSSEQSQIDASMRTQRVTTQAHLTLFVALFRAFVKHGVQNQQFKSKESGNDNVGLVQWLSARYIIPLLYLTVSLTPEPLFPMIESSLRPEILSRRHIHGVVDGVEIPLAPFTLREWTNNIIIRLAEEVRVLLVIALALGNEAKERDVTLRRGFSLSISVAMTAAKDFWSTQCTQRELATGGALACLASLDYSAQKSELDVKPKSRTTKEKPPVLSSKDISALFAKKVISFLHDLSVAHLDESSENDLAEVGKGASTSQTLSPSVFLKAWLGSANATSTSKSSEPLPSRDTLISFLSSSCGENDKEQQSKNVHNHTCSTLTDWERRCLLSLIADAFLSRQYSETLISSIVRPVMRMSMNPLQLSSFDYVSIQTTKTNTTAKNASVDSNATRLSFLGTEGEASVVDSAHDTVLAVGGVSEADAEAEIDPETDKKNEKDEPNVSSKLPLRFGITRIRHSDFEGPLRSQNKTDFFDRDTKPDSDLSQPFFQLRQPFRHGYFSSILTPVSAAHEVNRLYGRSSSSLYDRPANEEELLLSTTGGPFWKRFVSPRHVAEWVIIHLSFPSCFSNEETIVESTILDVFDMERKDMMAPLATTEKSSETSVADSISTQPASVSASNDKSLGMDHMNEERLISHLVPVILSLIDDSDARPNKILGVRMWAVLLRKLVGDEATSCTDLRISSSTSSSSSSPGVTTLFRLGTHTLILDSLEKALAFRDDTFFFDICLPVYLETIAVLLRSTPDIPLLPSITQSLAGLENSLREALCSSPSLETLEHLITSKNSNHSFPLSFRSSTPHLEERGNRASAVQEEREQKQDDSAILLVPTSPSSSIREQNNEEEHTALAQIAFDARFHARQTLRERRLSAIQTVVKELQFFALTMPVSDREAPVVDPNSALAVVFRSLNALQMRDKLFTIPSGNPTDDSEGEGLSSNSVFDGSSHTTISAISDPTKFNRWNILFPHITILPSLPSKIQVPRTLVRELGSLIIELTHHEALLLAKDLIPALFPYIKHQDLFISVSGIQALSLILFKTEKGLPLFLVEFLFEKLCETYLSFNDVNFITRIAVTQYGIVDWIAREFAIKQIQDLDREIENKTREVSEVEGDQNSTSTLASSALFSDVKAVFSTSYSEEKEAAIEARKTHLREKILEINQAQDMYAKSRADLEQVATNSKDPAFKSLLEAVDSASSVAASSRTGESLGLDLASSYNEELQRYSIALQQAKVEVVSLAERRLLGATVSVHLESLRVFLWAIMKLLRFQYPRETIELVTLVDEIIGLQKFLGS